MDTSLMRKSRVTAGVVQRVVGDHLAYIRSQNGQSLVFSTDSLDWSIGKTLGELGIAEGTSVAVDVSPDNGTIEALKATRVANPGRSRGLSQALIAAPHIPTEIQGRAVLRPEDPPIGSQRVSRALPSATRNFAKLLDTTALWAGDLILTRPANPDRVSIMIQQTQLNGGYGGSDSEWTHATMYLGDNLSVVEATFISLLDGSVRVTSLDEYCQGEHALRVRRPNVVTTERDGWRVCLRALRRLGCSYQYRDALNAWWAVRMRGHTFASEEFRRGFSKASLCSTLYGDSVAEALRHLLGEVNGWCTPAWLSASMELIDIPAQWTAIS